LNRDHVLAQPILASVFACDTVETWISEFLSTAYPQPRAVFLFGSFARRDGTVDSDVDVFVVRPDPVDEDHTSWAHMRADLVHRIERWTGNRSQLVEVSSTNLADAIASDQPLLKSLLVDGRVLSGDPIDKLLHLRRPIEQTEVKR
jgi:predicted nucleotidyltransferase